MEKRLKLFWRMIVGVVSVCIAVFVWLALFMTNRSRESIAEVSDIYMSEMSRQFQQKFTSLVNLRLEQVEGVIRRTPPSELDREAAVLEQLQTSAEVRNFSFLGFYAESGGIERVYGEEIKVPYSRQDLEALTEQGHFISVGTNAAGDKFLVMGKSAAYTMADGVQSVALLGAVSMDYLDEAMFLDEEDASVYVHVIDTDGNYIIRSGDAYRQSYFERLEEEAEKFSKRDGKECVRELKEAMLAREDYSTTMMKHANQQHIYCSPISDSANWYLVMVMSEGVLDRSISKLDTLRIFSMLVSGAAILLTMSFIFIVYYRTSQRQMKELDLANREANHANKAKSEFLSSMSHDIRTPMNAIIGMAEIAAKNMEEPEKVKDCLNKILFSCKHLLGLVNDILDMSKIESGKMMLNNFPMSLRDAMNDIVNIMQPQIKEKNQIFDIFINKIIAENVYCDNVRFNQVLLNLLSNAVKFTPEGGRIDIYVEQEESSLGEEYVCTHLRVTDTGIGISKEFQERIFDTFSREESDEVIKTVGTGLGMAITKSILELMGGKIDLQSKQGEGSSFHITLDLKKSGETQEEMCLPGWNVLVVDDNEQLCLSAVSNLKALGVYAEWTTDGGEAVRLVQEHHEKGNDYHFVLVDWKMPGMNGVQTIQQMRMRGGENLPIFLISSYDWTEIESEASKARIEGFIPKPLFKSTLYERLKTLKDGVEEKEQQRKEEEIDFSGKRVLVAEDIDLNWEVAYELFSAVGLELERAVNGKECIEMFECSEIGYYDAIFMDIRMPVMNGYDAARGIRALARADKDLPIIAMTADAFSGDIQQCLDCGMNAHISKPIDLSECVRLLKEYL